MAEAASKKPNGSASSADESSEFSLNDWRKQSGLTCSFVIFAALNIVFMYMGITNLHRCPAERMVPIYLVGELGIWAALKQLPMQKTIGPVFETPGTIQL